MQSNKFAESRAVVYLKRGLIGAVLALVLVMGGVYYASSSNGDDSMHTFINWLAEDRVNGRIDYEQYAIESQGDFPWLHFSVDKLTVKDTLTGYSPLQIDSLHGNIHFWKLLFGRISLSEVTASHGQIILHELLSTVDQKEEKSGSRKRTRPMQIDRLRIYDVYVAHEKERDQPERSKSYRGHIDELTLQALNASEPYRYHLDAFTDVEGLVFKAKHGPFLENKQVHIIVDVTTLSDATLFENGQLITQGDTLQINGKLQTGNTYPQLSLSISTDSILFPKARTLLNTHLKEQLGKFSVSEPLWVNFQLSGELKSRKKPRLIVDFGTNATRFSAMQLNVSDLAFEATFRNDCHSSNGVIKKGDGCIEVSYFNGKLYDAHPVDVQGTINDLKALQLTLNGTIDVQLPAIHQQFSSPSLHFTKGTAAVAVNYVGNFKHLLQGKFTEQEQTDFDITVRNAALATAYGNVEKINASLNTTRERLVLSEVTFEMQGKEGRINGDIEQALPFLFGSPQAVYSDLHLRLEELNLTPFLEEKTPQKNTRNGLPLGTMLRQIQGQVQGTMDVEIGEVHFKKNKATNVGFDLTIASPVSDTAGIRVGNIRATIEDEMTMTGAVELLPYPHLSGNIDFAISGAATAVQKLLPKNTLSVQHGDLTWTGHSSFSADNLADRKTLFDHLLLDSELHINNLTAVLPENNTEINNLNATLLFTPNTLKFQQFTGAFKEMEVSLSGKIDRYLHLFSNKTQPALIDLKLEVSAISLEKNSSSQPLLLRSLVQGLEPYLRKADGQIALQVNDIKAPWYDFNEINGVLQIKQDAQQQPYLAMNDITAKVFGKTRVEVDLSVQNLRQPILEMQVKSTAYIADLSEILYNDDFVPQRGEVDIEMTYKNMLSDTFNVENYLLNADIEGKVVLDDVAVDYPPRGLSFADIDGEIDFTERVLKLHFPAFLFNQNVVNVTGYSEDFLPFFFSEDEDFVLNLDMNSPAFDFSNFATPQTLKAAQTDTLTNEQQEQIVNAIDRLLADGEISLNANIDELKYSQFLANRIVGRANITDSEVLLDTFRMEMAGGNFGVNGQIIDVDKDAPLLSLELDFSDIDAPDLFTSFDNFGQDKMVAENIPGKLFATVNFSAELNDNYEVQPASMQGDLQINVHDGAFNNFAGLTNLRGFLFNKRRLEKVYFGSIESHISIDGYDIYFEPFLLNSTAATLHIKGLYTYDAADKTSMIIGVPVGNIFKRYVPQEEIMNGTTVRGGFPVYIKVKEKDKKLKFRLKLRNPELRKKE